MSRHLKALATVIGCIAVACAVKPLDVATYPTTQTVRVMISPDGTKAINALADLTRKTRKEQAACVVTYAVLEVANGARVVAINELGPSRPYASDSLKVWTIDTKPFCDGLAASLHTHIVQNAVWGEPSEWDRAHERDWTEAPFKVLVSVPAKGPSKVTVYGIR